MSRNMKTAMKDREIEDLILGEIKRRGITWLQMTGGAYVDSDDPDCPFEENMFRSSDWSDRLIELISAEKYDPFAHYHLTKVSLQDLFRFWWNRIACQEDIIDDVLEDIFGYFRDKIGPKPKVKRCRHDLDFTEIMGSKGEGIVSVELPNQD